MSQYLSFSDAAEKVLREYGGRKPMHYREIIRIALKNKLISTKGLTPETTLTAVIGGENRRRLSRGEEPRFVVHGKGLYGLTEWESRGILKEIQKKNKEVKRKLHQLLMSMDPKKFEDLIGELLANMGFENVEVTKRSGDGGIDVRGELVVGNVIRTKMAVQVKKWKSNVQSNTIRDLRGGLGTHDQGLVITTSDFSKGAKQQANRIDAPPIGLMNGKELIELLVEHQIGIKKKDVYVIEIDNEKDLFKIPEEKVEPRGIDINRLPVFGKTKGKEYKAVLVDMKRVKLKGKIYNSPSGAAKSITGYPVDGWHFWKYKDSKTGRLESINKLLGK